MQSFLDWLNTNAGGLTAATTIILAALTGVYIRQNGKIIGAMREQLDLALRIHNQDRRDLQEAHRSDTVALRVLAGRLLTAVAELPYPEPQEDSLRRAALWAPQDLAELERLARSTRLEVAAAAEAVRHLTGIVELSRRVKAVNPVTGFGFDQRDRKAYRADLAGAVTSLGKLADVGSRGSRVPPSHPALPGDVEKAKLYAEEDEREKERPDPHEI